MLTSTSARQSPKRTLRALSALVPLIAVLTAGCGAGTGSSLNGPSLTPRQQNGAEGSGAPGAKSNVSTQRLNLFLTSAAASESGDKAAAAAVPADAHLWATLYKIELLEQDEQRPADVVFEESGGRTVDLAALRGTGSDGKATLLARSPVSMGRKTTRVRLTFGKAFQRFTSGANVGTTALFAESVARDAEGRPILTAQLSKPRDLGTGRETLLLSISLAESAAKDGTVVPVVKEVTDDAVIARLDSADRQTAAEFAGAVSDVSGEAPAQTFTLTTGPGRPLAVRLASGTVLTNADGQPSPDLKGARQQQAVVRGRLDLKSGTLSADAVTLYADGKSADASRVRGRVSDVSADGASFVIAPSDQTANLLPTQTAITVSLASDVVLRSRGGLPLEKDALKSALTVKGALAEVEGLYEPATATLSAKRVQVIESGSVASREVLVQGAPADVTPDGKGITLKGFSEWDGLAPAAKGVPVALTTATTLLDREGKRLTADEFLAAVKGTAAAEVAVRATGLLSSADGKLTATRLQLRPAPPKPAPVAAAKEAAKTTDAAKAAAETAEKKAEPPKEPEKK